jgi:hypothetical protein
MLAYWSMQVGRHEEAELLLDECLAIREEVVGASHPDVASAMTLKAGVQLATKRFKEASQSAHMARKILEDNYAANHWRVAAAANVEGAALAGLGQYDEAEGLLLPSDEILANAPMPGVSEQSKQRLVTLYTAWGKEDEALRYSARQ